MQNEDQGCLHSAFFILHSALLRKLPLSRGRSLVYCRPRGRRFAAPASGPARGEKTVKQRLAWLTAGALAGALAAILWGGRPSQALANTDRYDDYILCT